jgi:hypothetical protein
LPEQRPCEPWPLQLPPPLLRDRRPDPLAEPTGDETITLTAPLLETRPDTLAAPPPETMPFEIVTP